MIEMHNIYPCYKDKSIQMVTEVQMLPEPSDYLGPHPDYLKHISNDYFWPRINYLSCTWRLALRAS